MDCERIITHDDFDGIVSAALCSHGFGCERFVFTGPSTVARAEISIDSKDIVCDLPYPLECGMWFDHHPGNLAELELRGIDRSALGGRFDEKPSCARVVFEYLMDNGRELPGYFSETVSEADMIDSFDYTSVDEWRRETPGKLVDMSTKIYFPSPREHTKYLSRLVLLVRDISLTEVLEDTQVSSNLEKYREEERRMIGFLEESVSFLPEDHERGLIILDFTHHKRRPRIIRNLAYLVHPAALGIVTLSPLFRGGRKTNDFSVSMSLSMNMTARDHGIDVREIMRLLNIGDGHTGAAAGLVHCGSREEMLRRKRVLLGEIWELWKSALE